MHDDQSKVATTTSTHNASPDGMGPDRRFYSATHDEILSGQTADVYFVNTQVVLQHLELARTQVTCEVFSRRNGIFAGLSEVVHLLESSGVELWSVPEGEAFEATDVLLRIRGSYGDFGRHETALLGILASSCGWATAAREAKAAAGGKRVVCFGARHIHPAVAPVMEQAAVIGGTDGTSTILGAKLAGLEPSGTMPHALMLLVGDTVRAARAFNEIMPDSVPRVVLVDTFKDEVEEALRVAQALGSQLAGIRLDTPSERGGVTPGLLRELRARLDLAGFSHVKLFVSGGLTPQRIVELAAAGADAFGVGSYISGATPIDMTMDIKDIEDQPVAKRGRIPGPTAAPRLRRVL